MKKEITKNGQGGGGVGTALAVAGTVTLGLILLKARGEEKPKEYTLTINVIGQGEVDQSPVQATYESGTVVILTAVGDFVGWSGDLTGSTNPAQIIMNGNKVVTATFNVEGVQLEDAFWEGGVEIASVLPGENTVPFTIKIKNIGSLPASFIVSAYASNQPLTTALSVNCPAGGIGQVVTPLTTNIYTVPGIYQVWVRVADPDTNEILLSVYTSCVLTVRHPEEPPPTSIELQLASIGSKLIRVWAYDDGAWYMYDPYDPYGSDLDVLKAGYLVYIAITSSCTLVYTGSSGQTYTYNLVPGSDGYATPFTWKE